MEIVKSLQNQRILKYILLVFIGSIILTISAKIKIPFYPVPMTMQTFVVLFLGLSLGYKIGLASVSLYLLEGIMGLPVFSNSPEKGVGLIYFTGPTMGYLIGFLTATFLASKINSKDKIKLITDDPAAIVDVPHFCNEQGHQILESFKENNYDLFIIDSSKN